MEIKTYGALSDESTFIATNGSKLDFKHFYYKKWLFFDEEVAALKEILLKVEKMDYSNPLCYVLQDHIDVLEQKGLKK